MTEPTEMNGLEFVASMTSSLVWPALILIVAIIFRTQIKALIGSVSSFEGFGTKAQFAGELRVNKEAVAVLSATSVAPEPIQPEATSLPAAAGIAPPPPLVETPAIRSFPNASIAFDWSRVLDAIDRRAISKGLQLVKARSPVTHVSLMGRDLIDPDVSEVIIRLNELRNQAVHSGRRVSPEEAKEYQTQADFVIYKLAD